MLASFADRALKERFHKGEWVMQEKTALTMRKICKAFSGVRALQDVDFTLRQGEIHALMGENGAGKSTLIKVLTGVYQKDSGQIYINGIDKAIAIKSPQEAQALGISPVYQEITLCPNLTVAENMFIGRGKYRFVNWGAMRKKAKGILDHLGIPARPAQQLANCSLAVQQMVAIARAVDMDCKALILDEPTSSLDDHEVAKLFALMRGLKERGVGIVFVTHFLEQVYEVCDRITVLRNGELVGEYDITHLPRVELVSKMMGKELGDLSKISRNETAAFETAFESEPVYEADGLSSAAGVRPFDFQIRKGEVNGFTGLLGSGRSESVRAIFGADRVTGGVVRMNGKAVKISKPIDAMRNGIGYLPEDRKNEGVIADLSVRDNIIFALQVMKGFFSPFTKAQAQDFADEYIKALNIKTASADTPIKSLSGGNQQKVVLARWLLTRPTYLILDEPTRGIDIAVKVEIQKLVLKLAEEGMSITFISSEIEEMLRACSRLIVMRDRHIAGELTGGDMTQDTIMHTIAGGSVENA
jgi:simple sugar transport system ATP-binding protein